MSRTGRTTEEPSESPRGRGRLLALVATGIVAVALVALTVVAPWSDDGSTGTGSDATSTIPKTTQAAEDTPAADVPIGTIDTSVPENTCTEVVERLQQFSDAAESSTVDQLQPLFDRLSEFEADLFFFAQGAEWGDTMVEQLTVVRREWVDAGSAQGRGDTETANDKRASANERLADLVADPPCP